MATFAGEKVKGAEAVNSDVKANTEVNTKAETTINKGVEAVETNLATFSGVEAKDVLEIIDLLSLQDKNLIKQRLLEDLTDSETQKSKLKN